jgi:hypothetical protein
MIAPIKQPEPRAVSRGVRYARRLVASRLLEDGPDPARAPPPIPGWQAWSFTAWVAIIIATYFAHMAGWF